MGKDDELIVDDIATPPRSDQEEIDDLMSYQVARNIKEQIEDEVQYPGTIKVTVIRETRATEEAK